LLRRRKEEHGSFGPLVGKGSWIKAHHDFEDACFQLSKFQSWEFTPTGVIVFSKIGLKLGLVVLAPTGMETGI